MVEISITNVSHSIQWLEIPCCGVTTEGGATVCLSVKVALGTVRRKGNRDMDIDKDRDRNSDSDSDRDRDSDSDSVRDSDSDSDNDSDRDRDRDSGEDRDRDSWDRDRGGDRDKDNLIKVCTFLILCLGFEFSAL